MSAPACFVACCPDCGGGLYWVAVSCYCACRSCNWHQAPDEDLLILAAMETYRRNQPKEAA